MKQLSSHELEIAHVEDLLNHAWRNAIKYRFDPVVGRIHEEYLQLIKNIKKELEEKESTCPQSMLK